MTTLVVGASGATGRLLVAQLLERGGAVKALLRPTATLPAAVATHDRLTVIRASLLELSDAELAEQVAGCDAVASCLGHTLNLRGIYGQPRRLVTESVRRLCAAIQAGRPARPVKFVLVNTTGNRNRDLDEPCTPLERGAFGLIRLLLPPQVDNEEAAEYLRACIGRAPGAIEWVAVRPDTLINQPAVSPYSVHASPTRSPLFDPGKTSRINVAHFMAALIADDALWVRWRGQMPVIYDDPPDGRQYEYQGRSVSHRKEPRHRPRPSWGD
jgi:hypothetical protein